MKNSILTKADFELNWDKIVFRIFTRKEAVFWKTNYSSFCFSLGTTYEQNMNEIDFLTCATICRYLWKAALYDGAVNACNSFSSQQ